MKRRSFFATLCGLFTLPFGRRKAEPTHDYPWSDRIAEFEELQGPYAHIAAFQSWASERWEPCWGATDWDDVDLLNQIVVMNLCYRAIDESRKAGLEGGGE